MKKQDLIQEFSQSRKNADKSAKIIFANQLVKKVAKEISSK